MFPSAKYLLLALVAVFTIAGCGRPAPQSVSESPSGRSLNRPSARSGQTVDADGSLATSRENTPAQRPAVIDPVSPAPTAPPVVSSAPATSPAPVAPVAPAASAAPAPTQQPSIEIESWNSWKAYVQAPDTELSYWDLKVAGVSGLFDIGRGLSEFIGRATNPFYTAPAREENFVEQTVREYEETMDEEYYFIRVPKFRAPVSKKSGSYFPVVAIAPDFKKNDRRDAIAEESLNFKVGTVQHLQAGETGEGMTEIITIPKSAVQTAFGYWNESVVIQFGIVEVDPDQVGEDVDFNKLVLKQFVQTRTLNFYNLEPDDVQLHRAYWTGPTQEKGAAIDIEFWKGSWSANNH